MTVDSKGNAYWYVIEHAKGRTKAENLLGANISGPLPKTPNQY